jgi:hypothetical protein
MILVREESRPVGFGARDEDADPGGRVVKGALGCGGEEDDWTRTGAGG